ncbi:MAG: hypothetical protein ACRC2K_00350 [Clostridium sp.]
MGDIIFTRPDQDFMKIADYKVYANGHLIAKVRNESRKVVSLKPGKYNIEVNVMGMRSNTYEVDVKAKSTTRLTCESKLTGIKYLFSLFYMVTGKESFKVSETTN